MLGSRVHMLYCNLNPPENFCLNYTVSSFWCPIPIAVSDGIGPENEKEVKYIQLPNLSLNEYQQFLENNSEEVPKITIKVMYGPTILNERVRSIDVGVATLKMNADLVHQNRPMWKWLNIKSQWNEKVCGKLFIQFSAKIIATSLLQPVMVPEAEGAKEETLMDEVSVTGSPKSTLTPFEEVVTNEDTVLSTPSSRDSTSGFDGHIVRKRPLSGIVRPFPLTPFSQGRRSFETVTSATEEEMNLTTTTAGIPLLPTLPSALTRHDGKASRPKKSVSFRIKSIHKFTSRNNLFSFKATDASCDNRMRSSKIPVPVLISSAHFRKEKEHISSKLNTSMPI